jgi:hypothetical protein
MSEVFLPPSSFIPHPSEEPFAGILQKDEGGRMKDEASLPLFSQALHANYTVVSTARRKSIRVAAKRRWRNE